MINKNNNQQTWPILLSILLGLVTSVCLAIRLNQPIVSFDLWWHMVIGKHFLATGNMVFDNTIFTWTDALPYHPYNAWISQIILHLTYEFANLPGLIILRYTVFFGVVLLAFHFAYIRGVARHPLSLVIITVGMMFSWTAFLVKPELFSIGLFPVTVWLYYLIRSAGDKARYSPYLIPILLVAWLNSHGAFFISSLFFASVIIGELLNARFSPTQSMSPQPRFHLFVALALCFPALLINPYGYDLPLIIIQTMFTPEIQPNAEIIAYKPTSVFNEAPHYLLDYLIISMFLFILLIWQQIKNKMVDWVTVVTFVSYCALFVQMGRVTYFLCPVFIFAGLDLLSHKNNSSLWPTTKTGKATVIVICIAIMGLISWRTYDDTKCDVVNGSEKFNDRRNLTNAPIDETEFIKNRLSGKRIGNTYPEGGYLLHELWPERKVLIDTREYPFREWVQTHFDFQKGIKVEEYVKKHKADYWLINYGYIKPFIWFVNSSDWKIAYLGQIGAVFVPSSHPEYNSTTISPNVKNVTSYNRITIALAGALQLNDLTFAKHIQKAAATNLRSHCPRDIQFNKELNHVIKGYEAFNKGDFLTAIDLLNREAIYVQTPAKALQAMLYLANNHWNSGEYLNARRWLVDAFNKKPHIIDLYNIMLIDWHMRNTNKPMNTVLNDGMSWKKNAEYIVSREAELLKTSPKLNIVIDVAKDMISKRYKGDASLISRFTLVHIDTKQSSH